MRNLDRYLKERRQLVFLNAAIFFAAVIFTDLFFSAPLAHADRVITSGRVGSYVNVRERPSMSGKIYGSLPPNEDAFLIRAGDRWHKIRLWNGYEGYVSRSYTRIIPNPPGSAESYSQWPWDRR